MVDQIKTPKGITLDRYLDAVRAGAHDAVAEMLRGESGSPNADFVNAIRDGIAAASRLGGPLSYVP
jgi:hypothetical protein